MGENRDGDGGQNDALRTRLTGRVEALWADERGRVILWTPVLIGLGIGLYFLAPAEPDWRPPAVMLGTLLLALLILPRGAGRLLAGALALVALGFLAALWRTLDVAAPVLDHRMRPASLEGRVDAIERKGQREARIEISVRALGQLAPGHWPARVRVTARTPVPADLRVGDRIATRVLLWPPPPPSMPGDFDYGRDLFFARIGALGVTIAPVTVTARAEDGDRMGIERLRQTVSARIRAAVPGPEGALGDAFVTGYRAAIPKSVDEAMRNSGLSHLISISGLHMSMVVGIVFLMVRGGLALSERMALRYPIKKWAAALAGIAAFAYLGLSGASVPAQRSFLMALLMLVAVMLDRQPLSLRFVAAAASVLLLLRPEALLNVSFQMSFAAVFALIAIHGELSLWRNRRRGARPEAKPQPILLRGVLRGVAAVGAILLSSVIAELAVAPAALYHFHQTALYGMAANLVAIPLTGIWIMPCLVLGVVLMPLGLEVWPLKLAGLGLDVVIRVAEIVSAQPGALLTAPAFPTTAYVLVMMGGLWLLLWRTRWRLAGLALIAGGVLMAARPAPPDIIIAGEGELVALRAPDGSYWMPPGRKGTWTRDRWSAYTAADIHRWAWAADGGAGDWLRCDALGCIYAPRPGIAVAIVHDGFAFAEDCTTAGLVISALRAPRGCAGPAQVIDRAAQRRNGGHAVRFVAGDTGTLAPVIASVGERRNGRPWGGWDKR